jgi:hypothetical protein
MMSEEKKPAIKAVPEPEVVTAVVCRKVQLTFFFEETRNGEFAGEFKPESVVVPEVNFDQALNLREVSKDLCRQVAERAKKGSP